MVRKAKTKSKKIDTSDKTVFIPKGKYYKLMMTSRLMVVKGADHGLELTIEKERVTIGRSKTCDLVLTDPAVSSLHAELVTEEKCRVVRDLGSRNGIYFRDHRVNELELQPGTQFNIGNDRLRFDPLDSKRKIPFSHRTQFGKAMGRSVKMREIFATLEKVSTSDLPLLLCGQTGTGKELLASAVHTYSMRKNRPFVVLDCGAVAADTIESTLFGHEKGAFTSAESSHRGVFEEAKGGTLFLDEVGELNLDLQPKLLRVLQEKEVQRVGGVKPISVDVRVVAATNRDLRAMVDEDSFREDLLYRLAVFEVQVPPLRERMEDILFLADHFIEEGNQVREKLDLPPAHLDDSAFEAIKAHSWPGNVRELRNVIERTLYLAEKGVISRTDLQMDALDQDSLPRLVTNMMEPYKKAKARLIEQFERQYLSKLIDSYDGNISRAAKKAGLVRHHLRDLCQRYGIPCGKSRE